MSVHHRAMRRHQLIRAGRSAAQQIHFTDFGRVVFEKVFDGKRSHFRVGVRWRAVFAQCVKPVFDTVVAQNDGF
ncbi:hypothetical protein D3C86_1989710 [compost metagenome]